MRIKFDRFDGILAAISGLYVLFLFGMEAYTAAKNIPTISERVQNLNHVAPIFGVGLTVIAGGLLVHFFATERKFE